LLMLASQRTTRMHKLIMESNNAAKDLKAVQNPSISAQMQMLKRDSGTIATPILNLKRL